MRSGGPAVNWTTPGELKAQVTRLWDRGDLLRAVASGESVFPLRLKLKKPGSAELAGQFDAVRGWIAAIGAIPHIRVEWRAFNHRVLGAQRLPHAIWLDSLDAATAWIGKRDEAARFTDMLALTRARQPALIEWLGRRPLQAVGLAAQWPRLLDVVGWLRHRPRPGIYLRQVDIAGVHSKFIEAHRSVLAELLDLVLPADAIAAEYSGVARFAARYGFLDKPVRLRFRLLDPRITLLPGPALPDITMDADSFARLDIPVRRVFITENETNFLAFPAVADAIVLFGAGYGWDALARADWLTRCTLHYWGDIDTHGFAILDQLRSRFDHVESLLMDRGTLMTHEAMWGEEELQTLRDLPRLSAEENALFDALRDNRIRKNLRLEQERIRFGWLQAALETLDAR